jgi:hypothetical protein
MLPPVRSTRRAHHSTGIFLPQIVKGFGLTNLVASVLSAVPYVFASAAMPYEPSVNPNWINARRMTRQSASAVMRFDLGRSRRSA